MKKLLCVIDYQNDFVDGALGFAGASSLEEGIEKKVREYLDAGHYVLFTRDTHQQDYLNTREGKSLPVVHCIEGTVGHQLYGALHQYEKSEQPKVRVINKETFGAADIAFDVRQLCRGVPDEIELCGLVTDICVVSNAILLFNAFTKSKVSVLSNLCGSSNNEGAKAALLVLQGLGIFVE